MPPKKRQREEVVAEAKKSDEGGPKGKKKSRAEPPAPSAAVASAPRGNNDALVAVFEQLMVYESKAGNTWGGGAYQKVAAALKSLKKVVTAGADVANVSGFGKASVEKIDEFIKTGKIQKLEDLKAMYGELPTGMILGKSSGGGAKGAKGAVNSKPSKEQLKQIAKEAEALGSNSIDQLKQLLRQNGQAVSGTKGELIERCSQGAVLGAIPICPLCGAGKLRFAIKTGVYTCPGFMDDDTFHKCVFASGSVARTPWKP